MPSRHPRRRSALILALLLALFAGRSGCYAHVAPKTQMVAMADGVKLATDVYLPAKGRPPYPVILVRTPYGKDVSKSLAPNLTPHGYAVVVQDLRGRFASEGHHAIIFGNGPEPEKLSPGAICAGRYSRRPT